MYIYLYGEVVRFVSFVVEGEFSVNITINSLSMALTAQI